ncbi:hypothetical protein [Nocardiopsis sp. FR6]|uniref:hypothetical protein n=2 Tax=unclassified Nocardiopsis TaxID=2649073 RepID=UPI001F32D4C2|nr:hypothetical protein [Nocardiopsis sp. FR6]
MRAPIRRIEAQAVSMSSMPHTFDSEEQPSAPEERPHWLVSALVVLVCLAVVASGWGVARLAVGVPLRAPEAADGPESRTPRSETVSDGVSPEDAEAYLAASVELVEGSSAFHLTFSVYDGGSGPGDPGPREAGRGSAVYEAGAEPEFDHSFTTEEGRDVYRYDVGGGQFMMTADRGLELLDPPSAADRYLCSRDFGSAKLREVLDTSSDLELAGLEEVRLEWPGLRSTHSAYHYTGTFTAMLGGYDAEARRNTLTSVEGAGFDLWIDRQGYPRRLDYRTQDGVGESYEYHAFS